MLIKIGRWFIFDSFVLDQIWVFPHISMNDFFFLNNFSSASFDSMSFSCHATNCLIRIFVYIRELNRWGIKKKKPFFFVLFHIHNSFLFIFGKWVEIGYTQFFTVCQIFFHIIWRYFMIEKCIWNVIRSKSMKNKVKKSSPLKGV